MQTHIILTVLAAAFCHALWNAAVKLGGDKILSLTGIQVAILLIALPLAPLVGLPHPSAWPYLFASAAIHFGYYLCLANAYRHGDFAQAYPVARGAAPILVTLFGVFVLREKLNTVELASLVGVIGGIMIFATRRLGVVQRKAMLAALATAFFIGAYTIVDGVGGRASNNIPAYMVWLSILDGAPMAVYALATRPLGEVIAYKKHWRTCVASAALSLGAYWMVVWAMSVAPIALVSALRETSVIIAALIGAYYFKEPAGKRRIVGAVVIFLSIALLGFA